VLKKFFATVMISGMQQECNLEEIAFSSHIQIAHLSQTEVIRNYTITKQPITKQLIR